MKIKSDYLLSCLFINNIMSFNINEEYNKLIQIVDDGKFDLFKFTGNDCIEFNSPRINFLWHVLILTIKYPQVEPYLKNILNYFTVNDLEDSFYGWSILHCMCRYPLNISLKSFEMIINCVANVNIVCYQGDALTHILFRNACNNHINNILNLLINYGINLNVLDARKRSVLDTLICYQCELNEETKNCVTTIIDFGGITNNPIKNNTIRDFIEYYKCSSIKPAIKK